MRASVIIATHNRPEYICNTIRQALRQNFGDYEVIVVDQTQKYPDSVEADLASLKPHHVSHAGKTGPAIARNIGVAQAGDIVVFIDDDVEFGQELIGQHWRMHDFKTIAGVLGLIIQATSRTGSKPFPVVKWNITAAHLLCRVIGPKFFGRRRRIRVIGATVLQVGVRRKIDNIL